MTKNKSQKPNSKKDASKPKQTSAQKGDIRVARATIIAACIGAVALIVVAIVTNWSVINRTFFSKPKEISLDAHPRESGTALSSAKELITLETNNFQGQIGDTSTDNETRLFLTFDISDIPYGSKILDSTFLIQCESLTGDIRNLGNLWVQSYRYEKYDKMFFDANVPIYQGIDLVFYYGWNYDDIKTTCEQKTDFIASKPTLNEVIQNSFQLNPRVVQFVMYFDGIPATKNKGLDGITGSGPLLVVKYEGP